MTVVLKTVVKVVTHMLKCTYQKVKFYMYMLVEVVIQQT